LIFFRQNFRNLPSFEVGWPKNFSWPFGLFWPQLKLFGLKKFVGPFYAEKVSSEGKYYYSILFGNTFAKHL